MVITVPKDKRGTNVPNFDPNNSDTWTKSMKEANARIRLVTARMEGPNLIEAKPKKKVEWKMNLVRGNSGYPIRSSSRNK